MAVGTVWSLYNFTRIYKKPAPTDAQIHNLNTNSINGFDRWAVNPYSSSIDKFSYYPFYAAMPLPVLFLLKDETRKDFWKLGFLYWEALSVTGLFGTSATWFVDRYRPFTYSNSTSLADRESHQPKNSFYAGHVQIVSVSTFFTAKVFSDYYPDSKYIGYGIATVATASMAYMRLKAGMHFPSDILIGAAMGAASGILVPELHKHKLLNNSGMSITPFSNGSFNGLSFVYSMK